MRFARNMRRDGKAFPDASPSRRVQNGNVSCREANQLLKVGPCKADARPMAGAVHGIDTSQAVFIKPFGPTTWVIVNAECRTGVSNIDMVRQREVAKAEIGREVAECTSEITFGFQSADVSEENVYAIEHPSLRFRRETVFQVTVSLGDPSIARALRSQCEAPERAAKLTSPCGPSQYIPLISKIFDPVYMTKVIGGRALRIRAERSSFGDALNAAADRPLC